MIISCIGDCGIDEYTEDNLKRPGGITLNFAVHARKLFPKSDTVEVLSVLGHGKDSQKVLNAIDQNNLKSVITFKKGPTPVQYIKRTSDGEKIFSKYEEGVLKDASLSKEQTRHAQISDFLITPLYTQIETFFQSVITLKTKGLKAVDFMDLSDYGKSIEKVEELSDNFDIGFFGLDMSNTNLIGDLQILSATKQKLFVITLGKNGSIAFENGRKYYQQTPHITEVVDTTGAGDAFAAAFIREYLYTKDINSSLQKGNDYAKQVIQQIGTF